MKKILVALVICAVSGQLMAQSKGPFDIKKSPRFTQRVLGCSFTFLGHDYKLFAAGEWYSPIGKAKNDGRDVCEFNLGCEVFAPINADRGEPSPDNILLVYRSEKRFFKMVIGKKYEWSGGAFTLKQKDYTLRDGSFTITAVKGHLLSGTFDAILEENSNEEKVRKKRYALTAGRFTDIPFERIAKFHLDEGDGWPNKMY